MTYDHIPRAGEVHASRIRPGDDSTQTFAALTGKNPGALAALIALVKSEHVDPDAGTMAALLPLEQLDALGIYETFAYLLFNDVCERNAARVRALLRAVDLGIIPRNALADAIEACRRPGGRRLNITLIVEVLRQTLPRFDLLDECGTKVTHS